MPSGILIDLNDGGKPMEITSGIRCPSFGAAFAEGYNQPVTLSIPDYIAGSQVICIPRATAYYDSSFKIFHAMGAISLNGATVTQNIVLGNGNYAFGGSIWQILPASTGGRNVGLFVSGSTDFVSITTASSVGVCVWKGTVTIPKIGWPTPTIPGYDRNKYIVFARWNSSAVIDFDGGTIRAFNESQKDDDDPTTATLDIVIFASGVVPTPGPGINIFNAAGQCTFSTVTRPFIFNGTMWSPSTAGVNVGTGYVPLGRFGCMRHIRPNTKNQYVFRMLGLKMINGVVSVGEGKYIGWDALDRLGKTIVTSLSLPIVPDMYL